MARSHHSALTAADRYERRAARAHKIRKVRRANTRQAAILSAVKEG